MKFYYKNLSNQGQSIQLFRCYLCGQIFFAETNFGKISCGFHPRTSSVFDLCQCINIMSLHVVIEKILKTLKISVTVC